MKIFKKLGLFFLALMLVWTGVYSTVFSDDSGELPSETTVKEILREAYILREGMGFRFTWYEGIDDPNQIPFIESAYSYERERTYIDTYDGEEHTIKTGLDHYPVADGWSPDEVKQRLKNIMVSSLADKIIDSSGEFFEWYAEIEGKMCYKLLRGFQYGYTTPTRVYFEESDLENIRIVSDGPGKATVFVPSHRYERTLTEFDSRIKDFDVAVRLVKEDGKWKISGMDCFASMLSAREVPNDGSSELDDEIIINSVKAAIFDLYYYFTIGGCELDTDGFHSEKPIIAERMKDGEKRYYTYRRIEGDAGYISRWREFAAKFCTAEMADKLLRLDGPVEERNGNLFMTNNTYCSAEFSPKKATLDRISVNRIAPDRAVVNFLFPVSGLGGIEYDYLIKTLSLEIELSRTADGWRVSGGDFIDKLDAEFSSAIIRNPGTGSFNVTPILLACVLLLTVMKKRSSVSDAK